MASVPSNLTVIRENFQKPRSLSEIKALMAAATTDYVMLAGDKDIVDVVGPLFGGVHYLATHVTTRRAFRHSKPVVAVYDPILLIQFNYLNIPILHKDYVHLFPETAVEPWHKVMVRALLAGSNFSLVEGNHTIVEPWPRPELSGAYAPYRFSIDPDAVMEAVPTVLVEEINQQPFFSLRNPRYEAVKAFCKECSPEFIASLAGLNSSAEILLNFDYGQIRASNTNYVAWFEGVEEAVGPDTLQQLQLALEFPGISVVSPRLVEDWTIPNYQHPAYSTFRGIVPGFNSTAWMAQTRKLNDSPPLAGYVNNQAILREIP